MVEYKPPLGPLRELDLPMWARRQIEALQAKLTVSEAEVADLHDEIAGLNATGLRMSKVVEIYDKNIADLKDKLGRAEAEAGAMREFFVPSKGKSDDFEYWSKLIGNVRKGTAGQALLDKLKRYREALGLISEYNKDPEVRFSDIERIARAALGEGGSE